MSDTADRVLADAEFGGGFGPIEFVKKDGGGVAEDEDTRESTGGNDAAGSSSAEKTRVRTEFPETWLWSDYVTE